MFGRIFGRGKDQPDQAVCASCGRTLLAGEWTQQIVDDGGDEKVICSLCAQSRPVAEGERVRGTTTPANAGRVRESRSESDAFWKALKDKDLEIERLQAMLARAEAEKQELLGRLARSRGQAADGADASEELGAAAALDELADAAPADELAGAAVAAADVIVARDVVIEAESWRAESAPASGDDEPELAAATWGETPDELAAALAEFDSMQEPEPQAAGPAQAAEPQPAPQEPPAAAFEDTQPIAMDEMLRAEAESVSEEAPAEPAAEAPAAAAEEAPAEAPAEGSSPEQVEPRAQAPIAPILAGEADEAAGEHDADAEARRAEAAEREAAEREAEAAASLTLLQRGVDLLNVSAVPRKIAETNEHLGLPSVHVGFDGQTAAVTFLWTMGWYRFAVDIESGAVRMDDRGYDERRDLQPNAGVRADGTVHLAPAQISRAAAAKQATAAPPPQDPPEEPADEAALTAETPSVAAQKAPEFVSKSLLGQRSDDEANPWDATKARDFNWDR